MILDLGLYRTEQGTRQENAAGGCTVLSEAALASLLAQPNAATRRGLRNQFLLILLYDTGARIQELLGLRLRDLHLQHYKTRCLASTSRA